MTFKHRLDIVRSGVYHYASKFKFSHPNPINDRLFRAGFLYHAKERLNALALTKSLGTRHRNYVAASLQAAQTNNEVMLNQFPFMLTVAAVFDSRNSKAKLWAERSATIHNAQIGAKTSHIAYLCNVVNDQFTGQDDSTSILSFYANLMAPHAQTPSKINSIVSSVAGPLKSVLSKVADVRNTGRSIQMGEEAKQRGQYVRASEFFLKAGAMSTDQNATELLYIGADCAEKAYHHKPSHDSDNELIKVATIITPALPDYADYLWPREINHLKGPNTEKKILAFEQYKSGLKEWRIFNLRYENLQNNIAQVDELW